MNLLSLCEILRNTQHESEKPGAFEKGLTKAFRELGFDAKHIGGRDKPDILLKILGHKIVVDAKTTKEDAISETYINFDALDRYKESYKADNVGIVAVGFRKGYVRKTAKKRNVILIETEAVCKSLFNQMIYPYNPEHIYEIMFKGGKNLITPKDIEPSSKEMSRKIEMIKKVLS